MEILAFVMFLMVGVVLLSGYPVAFALGGTALVFAFLGTIFGGFDASLLAAMPNRLFGIMTNTT
ncbi:MAG: C4-dicarboxylate ABC transporter, partial [Gammaproteobacteria bacterium]|nr:C4-dicarboxylate ABC transporter [Gammaproteobacteria bacterium]